MPKGLFLQALGKHECYLTLVQKTQPWFVTYYLLCIGSPYKVWASSILQLNILLLCIESITCRCIEEMVEYEEDLPKIKQPNPVKK